MCHSSWFAKLLGQCTRRSVVLRCVTRAALPPASVGQLRGAARNRWAIAGRSAWRPRRGAFSRERVWPNASSGAIAAPRPGQLDGRPVIRTRHAVLVSRGRMHASTRHPSAADRRRASEADAARWATQGNRGRGQIHPLPSRPGRLPSNGSGQRSLQAAWRLPMLPGWRQCCVVKLLGACSGPHERAPGEPDSLGAGELIGGSGRRGAMVRLR